MHGSIGKTLPFFCIVKMTENVGIFVCLIILKEVFICLINVCQNLQSSFSQFYFDLKCGVVSRNGVCCAVCEF